MSPAQKEYTLIAFHKAGLTTLMCGDGTNDAGALKRADVGVSVVSHPALERVARGEVHRFEDDLLDGSPQMQLGDASIASPFTAKTPHVSAVLDIVRQGRCTLVTTIQMFKILAANGLLHSWSMTVLYLQGVRQGDSQSTVYGLVVAVVFALLSFTEPLQHLSSRRPTGRIFSSPVVCSIIGQSTIHLATLIVCVSLAKPLSDPPNPDAEFAPNEVNTIVYICSYVLQANVFAVNYRGHPFMTPFWENKRFSRILLFMWGLAFFLASGFTPQYLLAMLELVELEASNAHLLCILFLDTFLSFAWEFVLVRNVLGG
jgi:cation-transporting ATPase 13A1